MRQITAFEILGVSLRGKRTATRREIGPCEINVQQLQQLLFFHMYFYISDMDTFSTTLGKTYYIYLIVYILQWQQAALVLVRFYPQMTSPFRGHIHPVPPRHSQSFQHVSFHALWLNNTL